MVKNMMKKFESGLVWTKPQLSKSISIRIFWQFIVISKALKNRPVGGFLTLLIVLLSHQSSQVDLSSLSEKGTFKGQSLLY